MEIDLETKIIRYLTPHYPHHGYTRALYLSNGDILLSGPETFDPKRIGEGRVQCFLYVLDKRLNAPARSLGTKCSEGPAVSRKRMHIAWTHVAAQYPDQMQPGGSRMLEADVVIDDSGKPALANQRVIIESKDLPFRCTMETQNFRPPDEKELTFSAYGHQGTDVAGVDLATKKVVNYSNSPGQYDEPEGIFPDGQTTLVECDKQNRKGKWSGACGARADELRRRGAATLTTDSIERLGHHCGNESTAPDPRRSSAVVHSHVTIAGAAERGRPGRWRPPSRRTVLRARARGSP
jgi:hypothetical protein